MYKYELERPRIFTEDGQREFLKIRDQVKMLLAKSGAVRQQEATRNISGDSWFQLACIDRLVELGEIREITSEAVAGQHRVFVVARD